MRDSAIPLPSKSEIGAAYRAGFYGDTAFGARIPKDGLKRTAYDLGIGHKKAGLDCDSTAAYVLLEGYE